ncbi:hypothetical protein SAMN05443639_1312 [Stigmatella erecta]|uniref:GmrSD restriction endonucleases N-terminal domain-containing protein n=2 Tax=Stigmatella erecta TaxID=83460 RepID=A0A1I0LFT9_9BACT|nr:hypothetical protein SAMN05443639_1312 [Stigmatella erecta]
MASIRSPRSPTLTEWPGAPRRPCPSHAPPVNGTPRYNGGMTTGTAGSTPHLNDPKPSVDRIDELARRIVTGDILLPKFQREFVWKSKRVLALLDSIAKGYPIGSILLWRTRQELKSEKKIADLDVANQQAEYPFNYLLDGQQRLSTICGALFWNGSDPKSLWNIAYDLRAENFFHPNTLEELPLYQMRVNKLSNPSGFFGQIAQLALHASPDKDELAARAKALFDRFKDYKIAVVTLGDMSIKDVAPIFERINSQGVPLTRVDLLRAATWSKEFDLNEAIGEIQEELDEKGFREIESKSILRNLSASQGGGFSIEDVEHLRGHTPQARLEAAKITKLAYQRAVDFLVSELGVVSSYALPYANQITVLAECFRLLPTSPSPAQYHAMREWFWQTSFSGYFSGWNTGQMTTDLASVRAFASGAKPRIPLVAARPVETTWRDRPFRTNNALSKAFALVLAAQAPRDLLTGQRIDTSASLSWINQKEFHHFFPKKWLKSQDVTSSQINVMANIVYLTSASNKTISGKKPSQYLREAESRLGSEFEAVLQSNLIPPSAFDAAVRDDYEAFLHARSQAIDETAARLAGWPENVARAIVDGEDEDSE